MADSSPRTPKPASPPAADIPGAIAQTEHALRTLTDSARFEEIAVACLREFEPTLRRSGGAGDEQRDAVGGSLMADGDELVVTVSLEYPWAPKVERDLDGLKKHGHRPKMVWSVTNRVAGAKRVLGLEKEAPDRWGHSLKILDVRFLAGHLLTPELLRVREELLGLAPPQPPIVLEAEAFAARLQDLGAPAELVGRDEETVALCEGLGGRPAVELRGPGGVGKTRLAIETAATLEADRVRFIDDKTPLDSKRLDAEVAGADRLVLVIDNAHRRADLGQFVSTLTGRTGPTHLLLITRPGFTERLNMAIEGTAFASPDGLRTITLAPLKAAQIGDLVRAAQPQLRYTGAIEAIVHLAQGNPLVALIAHKVAVQQGGLGGMSRTEVFGSYAESAMATAEHRRPDVDRDDLRDVLTLVAALGSAGPQEEDLLISLLGISRRTLRHRLDDLADVGLLADSGGRLATTPDLLGAHYLAEAFFSARQPSIGFDEIWDAADDEQRDRICNALGGLHQFKLQDRSETVRLVKTWLVEQASDQPSAALGRAQSLAPALPEVAVAVIDVVLQRLPEQGRTQLCRTAMGVLEHVPDIGARWPRQLEVARLYFASRDNTDEGAKGIADALTQIYEHLPVDTSEDDGKILAHVQVVLHDETRRFWQQHADEPGAAETFALAAKQLLTTTADQTYLSAENDRLVTLSSVFLPATELTARAFREGERLLRETLSRLPLRGQKDAVNGLGALAHCAGGFSGGGYRGAPPEDLIELAGTVVAEAVEAYGANTGLPLPTRARIVEVLRADPWPADEILQDFRALLAHRYGAQGERPGDRVHARATALREAADPGAELRRWQDYLALAGEAAMTHVGGQVVSMAMREAVSSAPERVGEAVVTVLRDDGVLVSVADGALGEILGRPGGEALAREFAGNGSPQQRAAVAGGLAVVTAGWADEVLAELAQDEAAIVRSRVAATTGWLRETTPERIRIGLEACRPDDLDGVTTLLGGLALERDGRPVDLEPAALAIVEDVIVASLCAPRIDETALLEVLRLGARPEAIVRGCLARITWLRAQPTEFAEVFRRDALPDELADAVLQGAREEHELVVLDLVEQQVLDHDAQSTAVTLLGWFADSSSAITDRLAHWLRLKEPDLAPVVARVMRATHGADRLRRRSSRLVELGVPGDIADLVIEARRPSYFADGSERAVMNKITDEFAVWEDDPNPDMATVGREAVDHFRARAAQVAQDDDSATI